MPKGIRVFRRAKRPPHRAASGLARSGFFLAFFCLFWDAVSWCVWFTIAFTQRQWAMAAFGTIHGAIGLGILYAVVAGLPELGPRSRS